MYNRNGRTRWYHLSNALAIRVAEARKLANAVMDQVAQGKDPAAERKASRHAGTFEDLATRYRKYAETKNKSWKATDKLIKRYVLPSWGKLLAAEISRGDANALMADITAKVTANQVMASASAIFFLGDPERDRRRQDQPLSQYRTQPNPEAHPDIVG
jgi:hypothetical protein